jgi:hypothetical protein
MLNYIQWAIFLIILDMTRKKTDKKILGLESTFHDILICKRNDCRPFLEVLVEEPENISRQNLGILVGIFQIDDRSEDSSYVVNYLISIIKKEYFSRSNRGPVENFEAALHKANLALAKLATHENIGWIGKINAVCAVIEKNNLLLSQTGNASAFLLRNSTLTEITEIQDESTNSNPLKTFQDVISGKIEKNDKLILTTKEIFDIFSLEEIKKSALKFSQENFVQFLNTALINELDEVATLIIDITEKFEEIIEISPAKKIEELNVFSQTAFQKELSPKMQEKEKIQEDTLNKERQEIIQELKREPKDFVDKKTGHIYIKEPQSFSTKNSFRKPTIDFSALKEKLSALTLSSASTLAGTRNKMHQFSLSFWQKIHLKIAKIKFKSDFKQAETEKTETESLKAPEIKTPKTEKLKMIYRKLALEKKASLFLKKLKTGAIRTKDIATDGLVLILRKPTGLAIKSITILKNKWHDFKNKNSKAFDLNYKPYPWESTADSPTIQKIDLQKTTPSFLQKVTNLGRVVKLKKILPDFFHLKQITKSLNQKQKISALAVLALLLIVPYWIVKWENKETKKPEIIEETPIIAIPLEKDLNVIRIEKLDEVYTGNVTKILKLNDELFALGKTDVIDLKNTKTFPIILDFQDAELFIAMRDLKSIFLIKGERIISFSPVTGKFQDTKLNFPANGKIIDAKTYLTYMYLLDTNNNQIYRLPRAEGGFGEKKLWLKENIVVTNSIGMAINENVFLLNESAITKLFNGKKQLFSIENTATEVSPAKIYTEQNSTNLYVLDKVNARILKLDNDGKIIAQYYNAEIANSNDLAINEESGLIYLSNEIGVKSFKMN